MILVALMEPEHPGNIGAVARAMANFGLGRLCLVDPKADHLSSEAIARAKHGKPVLMKAEVIGKRQLFSSFGCLIATTSRTGTDYNIPRSPLEPSQLAELLREKNSKGNDICLLFGREGKGLANPEIRNCDFVVSIPSSPLYGTLNVSHAAAIIFYELFRSGLLGEGRRIEFAGPREKEVLLRAIGKVISGLDFATADKRETQRKVWKRIVGKSFLTKREAFAMIGFFKKLMK